MELLEDLDIPHHFLGEVVAPGTVDGELRSSFASAPGFRGTLLRAEVLPSARIT